jgi:hypothetical protein
VPVFFFSSGRRRLVDDAQDFEPGDLAGVLGRLALGIVEIGRDGDDGLRHLLAQIRLGGLLHLDQREGGDLRGRIFLALGIDPGVAVVGFDDLVGDQADILVDHRIFEAAADQALDRVERVGGIGHTLALGRLADQAFARIGEGDDRGRGVGPLGVGDDLGRRPFHDRHARIRGAQIDTDDFAHSVLSCGDPLGRPFGERHRPRDPLG